MKITVTVDVSEFYSEESGENFSESLKSNIAYQVKQEIIKDFKEKVGVEFNAQVAEEIAKHKAVLIHDIMAEKFLVAKIKKNYSGDMVSISEYINSEIERVTFNDEGLKRMLSESVKKTANIIGDELKKRYDIMFATQIVQKLNEQGMLKDEVAKLLLPKENDVQ